MKFFVSCVEFLFVLVSVKPNWVIRFYFSWSVFKKSVICTVK